MPYLVARTEAVQITHYTVLMAFIA